MLKHSGAVVVVVVPVVAVVVAEVVVRMAMRRRCRAGAMDVRIICLYCCIGVSE